uniref:Complexin 3 n=1 Tax=Macrostomum lignano TaxID=282301 RepID=A0A1I8FGS3_9PLAT
SEPLLRGIRPRGQLRDDAFPQHRLRPAAGLTSWLQLAFGDQGSPGTNFAARLSDSQFMASFIAKQLVGKQMDSVKGAMGNSEQMSPEEAEKLAERQAEIAEALAEEKRKRDEKHRKMESEREENAAGDSGQGEAERRRCGRGFGTRYNIQKKEEFNPMPDGEDVARQAWPQAQDAGGAGGGARPRGSGRLCLLSCPKEFATPS